MKNIVLKVDIDCKLPVSDNSNCMYNDYFKLKEFISNSLIDANAIMRREFPIVDTDIFISHSHEDLTIIKSIVSKLDDNGYKCFIDSEIWCDHDEIIEDLLSEIAEQIGDYKDIDEMDVRNVVRDNVNVILSASLMTIMNNSKVILLLDTEKYIDYVEGEEFTYSPWIYHELCCAQYIDINNQKCKPSYIRHSALNETIKFKYLSKYRFDSIKLSNLFKWIEYINRKKLCILSRDSIEKLYNDYLNKNTRR